MKFRLANEENFQLSPLSLIVEMMVTMVCGMEMV